MKLLKVVIGLLITLIVSVAQATTLKLPTDLDLLVLDGRKISGSLLKGADGLELDRGEHQLLFRVEKTYLSPTHKPVHWLSSAQIVTFTAQSQIVQIQLPILTSLRESNAFDQNPQFALKDEFGNEIAIRRDSLAAPASSDIEQAMMNYNLKDNVASVPRFAHATSKHSSLRPKQDWNLVQDPRSPTEKVFHLWYKQVDTATRLHFITLTKALHIC